MAKQATVTAMRRRRDTIRSWLDDEAPYTALDQKHLDDGSAERAYWHHGYQAALADILLALNSSPRRKSSKRGSAN